MNIKTKFGEIQRDRFGMLHYHYLEAVGTIAIAARDALEYRSGTTWFWFNGTPCPIDPNDTVKSLQRRWGAWRAEIQTDPSRLLELLARLTQGRSTALSDERYWLAFEGLPWQEATQKQYIRAEQAAGFFPDPGKGPCATASFGAKGILGRRTYGEISEVMGYDAEFVRIANKS